jgi:hypothetical protein
MAHEMTHQTNPSTNAKGSASARILRVSEAELRGLSDGTQTLIARPWPPNLQRQWEASGREISHSSGLPCTPSRDGGTFEITPTYGRHRNDLVIPRIGSHDGEPPTPADMFFRLESISFMEIGDLYELHNLSDLVGMPADTAHETLIRYASARFIDRWGGDDLQTMTWLSKIAPVPAAVAMRDIREGRAQFRPPPTDRGPSRTAERGPSGPRQATAPHIR